MQILVLCENLKSFKTNSATFFRQLELRIILNLKLRDQERASQATN